MSKETLQIKNILDKLLQTYPERFVIVFFKQGMAGTSVLRILLCHKEFSYSSKYLGQLDYDDPIRFPDSVEGFEVQTDHNLSFTEQHLACAHLGFYTPWLSDKYVEDAYEYLRLIKQNKFLALKTHLTHLYDKYKNCKCVFLYATNKDFQRSISCNIDYEFYKKIPDETFNIDVSRLFSSDYEEFLDEYLKIVYEFDLTPRINSVRSFVLLWLERQKRLNNFKQRNLID